MFDLEPKIGAPVAGMSMTHEVGARPWQQPPQYSKMEDVIDYYVTRMSDDSFEKQLVNVIDSGVPLTSLVNSIQLASVMQGVHSIDSGQLVMPVLMELMMLLAEQNNVKYTTGMERDKKEEVKASMITNALSKLEKENESNKDIDLEEEETVVEEADMLLEEQEPMSGLMSRRV